MKVRVVGILRMIDKGDIDDKIIAVNGVDPRFENILNINDIPQTKLFEISNFFKRYKENVNSDENKKEVELKGFGDRFEAEKTIKECRQLYLEY
jgi:inorganic pyrophosphatase